MRTSAICIAVLTLGAASIVEAQDGPGLRGGGGPGIGGGAGIDRGGGSGPSFGGEGRGSAGPAGGLGERGPAVERGPGAERRAASPERAGRGAERSAAPSAQERGSSQRASRRNAERSARSGDKEEKAPRRVRAYKDASAAAEKTQKAARDDKADRATKTDDHAADARARDDQPKGSHAAKQADAKREPVERVKKVDLSDDRRGRIRDAIHRERDLKPRKDVDVRISVGRRLPRGWDYRPVPLAVIDIVPDYRDYVFIYIDDEYVICDPDDYEIVAVIPAGGGAAYAGGGTDHCPARLTLSRDERELILDEVRMNDEVDVRDLEVGWSVPANVELQRFPDKVVSEADELGACRYFVAKDQLAIVDPVEEKVVLVIDKS